MRFLKPGTRVAVALRQNGIMPLPPYPAAKMGEQNIKQNFCAAGNPNAMGQTQVKSRAEWIVACCAG